MAGIARKNGSVLNPASFASGYSMVVLLVEANSNQFTADSGGGTTAITEGGFTKAIRSIQNIASMVYVGERANDQFVVIVDGPTAQPTGEAFNSDATPTIAERVKAQLEADIATLTATVTDISTLAAGSLPS
jgi:hypothetical protein